MERRSLNGFLRIINTGVRIISVRLFLRFILKPGTNGAENSGIIMKILKRFPFFFGKSVKGGRELAYNLSPMAGYSFGRFTGLSAALNGELEWKSLYLSSQTQYSVSTKDQSADFFSPGQNRGIISRLTYSPGLHFSGPVNPEAVILSRGLWQDLACITFLFPFMYSALFVQKHILRRG